VTEKAHDPVNHPAHYTAGGIECLDAIKAALVGETDPFVGYLRGQGIKYLWRAGKKAEHAQDLRKAIFYLDRAVTELEGK
jgi:hypothetical protein